MVPSRRPQQLDQTAKCIRTVTTESLDKGTGVSSSTVSRSGESGENDEPASRMSKRWDESVNGDTTPVY